jgi:hypothetical protein
MPRLSAAVRAANAPEASVPPPPADHVPAAPASPCRARLETVLPDGHLRVFTPAGDDWTCEWLDTGSVPNPPLAAGDTMLVMPPTADGSAALVLGRIGLYRPDVLPPTLVLGATDSVSLRCGESSVDLRADGKVMIRGDDVLVRAKGTQRIRAGTVAIN